MSSMELSIIIVNWNSAGFTRNCIASLKATTHETAYEIIVVDNASNDGLLDSPELQDPLVKVLRCERNIGFARANNLGAQQATGNKILFLNPDTVVLGDAIRTMADRLDAIPGAGAIGCRLLNADMTLQLSSVQPFPTLFNQLFALDFAKRRWPTLRLWGTQSLYTATPEVVSEVEVVSGACLMVRTDVFREVGGFSTDYFMYAEEMELCYRIRQAGRKVCHIGSARVVHFGGQSSQKQPSGFAEIIMRQSVFTLLRKVRGNFYALAYRAALVSSALLRLTVLAPLLVVRTKRGAARLAFRKWSHIAAWGIDFKKWSQVLRQADAGPAASLEN